MSVSKLNIARNNIIKKAGETMRIRHFTVTTGSVWDDERTLTSGTDLWVSGIVLPVSLSRGSNDSILVEQGNLIPSDKKIFVNGSVLFTGSKLTLKVQIGSPSGDEYEFVQPGGIVNAFADTAIYKKAYLRYLPGGSLFGEY